MRARKHSKFEDLVDRVDSIWDGVLAPEHIETIEDELADRQQALFERGQVLEARIKRALESHQTDTIEQDTNEFRQLQFENARLEKSRKRLYHKRQQRIIWRGFRKQLGDRGAKALEWSVLVLICVVLGILFAEMIYGENWDTAFIIKLYLIDVGACTVFLTEFYLRYRHAEDKRWFWKYNWVDLITCIPFPPPALLASLGTFDVTTLARLIRFFRLLRLLRAVRILALMWSGLERLDRVADFSVIKRAVLTACVLLFVGGTVIHATESVDRPATAGNGVTLAESGGGEDVIYSDDYPFTLWWTFNTISTGGFADLYKPVSPFAQLVTGALIIAGFVVLGVFIATLSAAFKGEDTEEMWRNQKQIVTALNDLQKSLDQAHRRIEALQGGDGRRA